MLTAASAGVPAGTENGVRRTWEDCAMNWMPPIFGSRKNVCVTPAVASPIRSFAAVEPGTPNPIGLPSTSIVTARSACLAVVGIQVELARGLNLRADQVRLRCHERDARVLVDDEVREVG